MQVIEQIVCAMMDMCNEQSIILHDFAEVVERLPILHLELEKKSLSGGFADLQSRDRIRYKMYLRGYHKKCYHHWRPEDIRRVGLGKGLFKGFNTGGLLWGERGCGKSQILAYLSAWAHESSWINVTVASCPEFVDASHEIERMGNGLYLQPALAARVLSDLKTQNEQIFRELDVDMSRFGQYDLTGAKDADGEPCPRTWDPLRQCWSDDWKQYLYDDELKHEEVKGKLLDYRLSDKCSDPKKLIDIVEAGIADPILATNAIAEILEQLYHQDDHHVLFTLDGYNTWLNPSEYDSFRYVNDPALKAHIPPRDLALVRLLLKFDGHMVRQGVKFASTTHYRTFNHIMTPEMVDWFKGYEHKVPNLTLNEFRNMLIYKSLSEWGPRFYREWQVESLYMET